MSYFFPTKSFLLLKLKVIQCHQTISLNSALLDSAEFYILQGNPLQTSVLTGYSVML